ncbi:MAG: LCP family protein [Firmicutes bacterium]|nr:LCP family protein [Alicyclobacillaceae bacterium]MCL6496339.1 LCP family protein [Bacillota bacterium]
MGTRKGGDAVRRWGWVRWAAAALGALVVSGAGVGYWYLHSAAVAETVKVHTNPGPFHNAVTILLLGNALSIINNQDVTNPYVRDRTDTMMLVSYNLKTHQAGVLSIPRDTLVYIPQAHGETKINEANYFGGPKLAVQLVEQTLHVPVDYYMETTMWNFAKIIDTIGGLTVDVTQPMNYGGTGNFLDIHLKPGVQHLDGQQVLEYVRFRAEPLGDIGRIQQQQYIVKLILQKMLRPSEIPQLPTVIRMLRKDIVYTNLTTAQMIDLGLMARNLNLKTVRYATIPGHPVQRVDPYMHQTLDYWVADQRLIPLLVDEVLLDRPLTAADRQTVHIVVRSGTQSLQPAQAVADWLRSQGFTVSAVVWANHHHHTASTVLDFTGDKYLAHRIAQALGPDTTVVESPYHDVPGVDMTITVGQDLKLNSQAHA